MSNALLKWASSFFDSGDRLGVRRVALSRVASLIVGIVGVTVILGWFLNIPILKSMWPGLQSMAFNTAVAFVLGGISLWCAEKQSGSGITPACKTHSCLRHCLSGIFAVGMALFGLLTLVEYVSGWDIGINQLLMSGALVPGRMAANSAVNFLLLGSAILLSVAELHFAAQFLAFLAMLIALHVLVGCAYIEALNLNGPAVPMALNTALCFIVLALGIMFTFSDRGWMRSISGSSAGAVAAKCLLPAVILVPLLVGWLRVYAEKAGYFGPELGDAAVAVVSIAVLTTLVWISSVWLNQVEGERNKIEQDFDRFFNVSISMFCIAGFDGYFKRLNPAWQRVLGFTNEELMARPFIEFVHPDDVAATRAKSADFEAGISITEFENRYRCKDGSYKLLSWTGQPVLDQRVFCATVEDVTERRHAEEQSAELAAIVMNSDDGIIGMNLQGFISSWNAGAERIFGYSANEIVGQPTSLLLLPEMIPQDDTIIHKIMSGELVESYETVRVRKDGRQIDVSVTVSPIKDKSRKVIGVSKIVHDITARKKAEELLRQSEERYRQIIETTREGVWVTEPEGATIFVNHQMAEMLLCTQEEMLGRSVFDFTFEEDRADGMRIFAERVEEEGGVQIELRYRRKDGSPLWALATFNPIYGDDGTRIGVLGMLADITERRQIDESMRALNVELEKRALALEAVNQELEAFSYSVSHDLRAPLRAIDGYTRIFMDDYGATLDKEGARVLGVVRNETQRMGQLIDDLLAFSRMGRQLIKVRDVNMTALTEEVFAELCRQGSLREPMFELASLPPARGDEAMLRQVMVNLLSNAIKFSSRCDHPAIKVGANIKPGTVTYFVQDNGAGFDMQYVGKLFGVFQRLHGAAEFEGTGVGLALVQRIVVRHGGRVWAQSKVGEGATFFFTLSNESQ